MDALSITSYPVLKDTGEWLVMVEIGNLVDEPDAKAFSADFNECGEIVFCETIFTPDA